MSSIFTYDPYPPRVASPWLTPSNTPKPSTPQPDKAAPQSALGHLTDYDITRLEAEPQEGPTEYKLHLLLRPRRTYSSSSTGKVTSSSNQPKEPPSNHLVSNGLASTSSILKQSKQKRIESLTTQLLWRLQQSSPYHSSSTSELILPKLPGLKQEGKASPQPGKLLAGLEESRGALYEIGVSDDGTFVGLTKDEMDESLNNLRAMAASLGCNVEIIRMVEVGDCEWFDSPSNGIAAESLLDQPSNGETQNDALYKSIRRQEQLWVAEALVTPDLSSRKHTPREAPDNEQWPKDSLLNTPPREVMVEIQSPEKGTTQQLRITLTGPTTSGKSSLLGTLSTATLDNGRGKSRLSLLKHRHEIESGVTSSVAQELIGYKDDQVINYASGNVTSWTDIHAAAELGRLVFVSDSAGHPRYRRTTVRGLVGWAPHWTVLCVAADDGENAPSGAGGTSTAQEILGTAGIGVDLTQAHLELCLKLEKPLAIVITKLDLASKGSLRQTLSKILSAIKGSGRTPSLLPPDPSKSVLEADLKSIPIEDNTHVRKVTDSITEFHSRGLTSIVPIVLTSAAKGTGIRMLHSLLQNLPIPPRPTPYDFIRRALNPEQPSCLYHIEDIFALPASYEPLASTNVKAFDSGVVVAGHLRFGTLSVGDKIVVGPFPSDYIESDTPQDQHGPRSSPSNFGGTFSSLSTTELARMSLRNTVSASVTKGEWHTGHIVSIRNLRLPVHTLEAGQVATVGIVLDIPVQEGQQKEITAPRIRKGMVLAIPSRHMVQTGHTLQAASGFTAAFEDSDISSVTVGSLVVVYIASIRGTARVLRVSPHTRAGEEAKTEGEEMDDDVFGLDTDEKELEPEPVIFGSDGIIDVSLELITNREWIELGSQVLIMPGGGHGLYAGSERGEKGVAGLEGFVGKVIEVVD